MPSDLDSWLAYIERQHPRSIDMGLERVREAGARMGSTRPAARVVTVAGTNGKGSTVAFLESVARAQGWRVGAYTSPHLFAYNERVRIDGHAVDDAGLVAAFEAVQAARLDGEAVPLTYFEFGTLAALWLFARRPLDLAILEVGLGGRLDATNLVDADVAVVTTVDLDHREWLGEDRERIGFEKAGIARAGRPLVLGDDDPPASVLRHAYAIGAPAIRAGCDFLFEPLEGGRWRWREAGYAVDLPRPALAAPVQLRNAAVAVAALRALDLPLAEEALARGIAGAELPGRLQAFERDGVRIVVDVGHNPQAAREVAAWLRAQAGSGATHAVYAALADKDVAGVAEALADAVDHWDLAGLPGVARALDAGALAGRLAGSAAGDGERHADVAAALGAARARARVGDRILVLGSFHAAAAALSVLQAAPVQGRD